MDYDLSTIGTFVVQIPSVLNKGEWMECARFPIRGRAEKEAGDLRVLYPDRLVRVIEHDVLNSVGENYLGRAK